MNSVKRPQDNDWNVVVGDNIRAELARQRWSARAVAARLGVQNTWVSRRLRGETPFDANDIHLFAELLDVPIDSLFETRKKAPSLIAEGRNALGSSPQAALAQSVERFTRNE